MCSCSDIERIDYTWTTSIDDKCIFVSWGLHMIMFHFETYKDLSHNTLCLACIKAEFCHTAIVKNNADSFWNDIVFHLPGCHGKHENSETTWSKSVEKSCCPPGERRLALCHPKFNDISCSQFLPLCCYFVLQSADRSVLRVSFICRFHPHVFSKTSAHKLYKCQ